jgi:hypothetical protein
MAVAGSGNRAGVVLTEDAVTVAGNEIVAPVTQGSWKKGRQIGERAPEPSQFAADRDGGRRPGLHQLSWRTWLYNQANTSRVVDADRMTQKDLPGEFTLQCRKVEQVVAVTLEDEANTAVAKPADTVVKNDRVGRIRKHGEDSNAPCLDMYRELKPTPRSTTFPKDTRPAPAGRDWYDRIQRRRSQLGETR